MRTKTLLVIAFWLLPLSAWAQEANGTRPMSRIWYVGCMTAFGEQSAHMADVHWGFMARDTRSYAFSVELNGMGILDRRGAQSAANLGIGVTPYFRLPLFRFHATSVFFEVGIGAVYYLREHPDGGSHLNFSRQFGLGLRKLLGSQTFFAAARWFHSSNQNIYGKDRNPGLNALGLFVGVEKPF